PRRIPSRYSARRRSLRFQKSVLCSGDEARRLTLLRARNAPSDRHVKRRLPAGSLVRYLDRVASRARGIPRPCRPRQSLSGFRSDRVLRRVKDPLVRYSLVQQLAAEHLLACEARVEAEKNQTDADRKNEDS